MSAAMVIRIFIFIYASLQAIVCIMLLEVALASDFFPCTLCHLKSSRSSYKAGLDASNSGGSAP